jgi:hypothetical protein
VRVARLPPWREALFHVLAWLPVDDPSSLWDPAYVRWARAALPAQVLAPVDEDRDLLAVLYHRGLPHARTLHALDLLHPDAASQREGLRRTLVEFPAAGASLRYDPTLHRALQALAPSLVELLRVALARVLAPWTRALEAREAAEAPGLTALEAALTEAAAVLDLGGVTVRAALPLGLRGRARGGEVLVGVPGVWGDGTAAQVAQQALHEHAVALAEATAPAGASTEARRRWVEAAAVRALDAALQGTALAPERARWRARHDHGELERPGCCSDDAAAVVAWRLRS